MVKTAPDKLKSCSTLGTKEYSCMAMQLLNVFIYVPNIYLAIISFVVYSNKLLLNTSCFSCSIRNHNFTLIFVLASVYLYVRITCIPTWNLQEQTCFHVRCMYVQSSGKYLYIANSYFWRKIISNLINIHSQTYLLAVLEFFFLVEICQITPL